MNGKLSKKQEDFCILYSSTLSPSLSARLAGYPPPAYRLTGLKLLKKPEIKKRIENLKEEENRLSALRNEAILALCRAAASDCSPALTLMTLDDDAFTAAAKETELFCISEIKRQKGVTEIKFIDRIKALEAVCRLTENECGPRLGVADLISAVKNSVGGCLDDT